jgi:Tfp pilus assembly protein PilV
MKLPRSHGTSGGFTLIEVIGAMVVFSLGVLMVMNLTGALAVQMNTSALRSLVAVTAQSRLDSLQVLDYDSLSEGTESSTMTLMGQGYTVSHTILQATTMVKEVEVTVEPTDGTGPHITASGYVLRPWG